MNKKLEICGRDDLFFIHGLLHKRWSFLKKCALAKVSAHTDYKKLERTLLARVACFLRICLYHTILFDFFRLISYRYFML